MSGRPLASDVPDAALAGLDRGGIWTYLWRLRDRDATTRTVRAVCRRWERLTGRSYYGEEE